MQAASSADYQPFRALRGSAPPKTRIPLQRYADRASVLEIHEEALVRYSDVPDSVLRAKFRSIHSKRPSVGEFVVGMELTEGFCFGYPEDTVWPYPDRGILTVCSC